MGMRSPSKSTCLPRWSRADRVSVGPPFQKKSFRCIDWACAAFSRKDGCWPRFPIRQWSMCCISFERTTRSTWSSNTYAAHRCKISSWLPAGEGGARVFREGTILSLFDSVLRGLRVVHQHSLLHLDIKPANIFITDDDRAVLIDFGAAREVLRSEGSFVRPMYTPGFAAPELYHRGARPQLGPWTDLYAIGACIYACMRGQPPCEAVLRRDKDRLAVSLTRLRRVYSNHLVDLVQWCMALDPASRPSSVFALQRELIRVPWPADHPPTATGARRRWPLPLRWIMRRIDSVLGPKNPSAA
jgi:serine/threonine protein kinase